MSGYAVPVGDDTFHLNNGKQNLRPFCGLKRRIF